MKRPIFQKRHYEAVAEVLYSVRHRFIIEDILFLVDKFSYVFGYDNPNFNPETFLDAIRKRRA